MTLEPHLGRDAASSHWKRFNDQCFSLHARLPSAPDALVSGLAAAGVELILDARPGRGADAGAMAAGCKNAGIYYVPALDRAAGVDVSDQAVTRYAKLALRHKTCVVVDDNAEELLRLIADQIPGEIVPLAENANDRT
jgi:hypothetical protein